MLRNYYTLLALNKEFQLLKGFSVKEIFTQEKDTVIINFSDGNTEHFLEFKADGKNDCIFLRSSFARARQNSADILSDLLDETLQSVELIENNRIFIFKFVNTIAYFYLFGGANSNLFVTTYNNRILDSLKNYKENKDDLLKLPNPNIIPFNNINENSTIADALSKTEFMYGRKYATLFCEKYNYDINAPISVQKNEIYNNAIEFTKLLIDAKYFYIEYLNEYQVELTLLKYKINHIAPEVFSSCSKAIQRRLALSYSLKAIKDVKTKILSKVNNELNKLSKKIDIYKNEQAFIERERNYRKIAELLISQTNIKEKYGDNIKLNDYDGTEISIVLNPKLNLAQNSQKYFEKARSAMKELKIMREMLPDLIKMKNYFIQFKEQTENTEDLKLLNKIKTELRMDAKIRFQNEATMPEERFRTFDLEEGYKLYVGKNAANNDELTMKFAKPNDYWFHSRGTSGSHCVLRISKSEKPPKNVIEAAASVAAYYSSAKNAKYTPVAYTQKKYVRKPKGANPGSVVISKETVIMVEPKLP